MTTVTIDSAELEKLRRDSREWEAQKNVIASATMENSLHISMRVNYRGRFITRDCVLANFECLNTVLGLRIVGLRTENYARDMYAAIDRDIDLRGKEGKPNV